MALVGFGGSRRPFAAYPAWAKLLVWLAAVVLSAAVIQGAAWLIGLDFDILSQSKAGRAVLLLLAVVCLLAIMAADRRPAADYGLVVGEQWRRQWFGALALGVASYVALCLLAVAAGALALVPQPSAYRWTMAVLGGMTALPLALSQQVIFSGYLLSLFRNKWVGALLVAALFAVASKLGDPAALLSAAGYPLLVGMFLIAALLAALRIRNNTILVPSGLLAGWVFARRLIRKTGLLSVADPQVADWLAPSGDPRQSPVVWALLAAAIAWAVWTGRNRSAPLAAGESIATSFKRVAPFSNLCLLAPLDLWIARLWQARFRIGVAYLPRLLAILVFSSMNTLLSLPERLLLPRLLKGRDVPDPLFIVGVHRSGTTHLQNLISLDGRFVTPLTYQVMNPFGFLLSGWLFVPLVAVFSPWKRPMDGVRFSVLAPQEDEFALAGMTRQSPYWGLTFPLQTADYDRAIHPADFTPAELAAWKRHYLRFLRALTFWSGKQPLLKNPYHTARVDLLCRLFPRARFIHIHRQPYAVYRSNLHMQREGHCMYQLQDPDERTGYAARFLGNYLAMEQAFSDQSRRLPANRLVEVCFEDLEKDPQAEIDRIYQQLELTIDESFRRRLAAYLEGLAGYQKNRVEPLDPATGQRVYAALRALFDRWGYDAQGRRVAQSGQRAA
ncbi:MAG: sulfotransferase [Pirellulales bacterium]